jgi:hypothetical protein
MIILLQIFTYTCLIVSFLFLCHFFFWVINHDKCQSQISTLNCSDPSLAINSHHPTAHPPRMADQTSTRLTSPLYRKAENQRPERQVQDNEFIGSDVSKSLVG